MTASPDRLRLDKWLWAARFYRTRSLAGQAIGHGRVAVNGLTAKAARELRPGDTVTLRLDGGLQRTVVVKAKTKIARLVLFVVANVAAAAAAVIVIALRA